MSNVYIIAGVAVQTRSLQSGDMAVWHRLSDTVRNVVEPICRGKGYWDDKYHNWVIKAGNVQSVLVDLEMAQRESA